MLNLDWCKEGQRQAVLTLDEPVMISAGAGSGKTRTLTYRIVNALAECEDRGAFARSIEQICAITFTKKAAAELKSRVKSLLIEEKLYEQANKIDDAYICTIHSLASRILRENSLAIGIDPDFEVLDETVSRALMQQALNDIAEETLSIEDDPIRQLLSKDDVFKTGAFGHGIIDDVRMVLSRALSMPNGLDSVVVPEEGRSSSEIMRDALHWVESGKEILENLSSYNKTEESLLQKFEESREIVYRWMNSSCEKEWLSVDFDCASFSEALLSMPKVRSDFHKNGEDASFFEEYRNEWVDLRNEALASISLRRLLATVKLARAANSRYTELKGRNVLDQNDLLRVCYSALLDHPDIADIYKDRFKLIMVDEFQDTDMLQVAIISAIAKRGYENVCTVGDAQQSIYRFRGADVNVFKSYQDTIRELHPGIETISLNHNFRSHSDVLGIVDRIFADPSMFGDEFLHLEASGAAAFAREEAFETYPRIAIEAIHGNSAGRTNRVSAEAVRKTSAESVAGHFSYLAENGYKPGDMTLLLGSMSHADVYVDALRNAGLDCMVVSGSTFCASDEAFLISMLLRYGRNPHDDDALFQLLTSCLFAVSDDVLLILSSAKSEEELTRKSLSSGFLDENEELEANLSENDRVSLAMARGVLKRFASDIRNEGCVFALKTLFSDCGYLDRLQPKGPIGQSIAGNLQKACRIVRDIEREQTGIATVSSAYDAYISVAKETPGVLSRANSDYVTIMTVHGSKGLEFDHVAIAELKDAPSTERFIAENIGDKTYVGSNYPASDTVRQMWGSGNFDCDYEAGASIHDHMDADEMYRYLSRYNINQERNEAKRLMYVALTRAVKSVFLVVQSNSKLNRGYKERSIYKDVHSALAWPTDSAYADYNIELPGNSKAVIRIRDLSEMPRPDEYAVSDSNDTCRLNGELDTPGNGNAFIYPSKTLPEATFLKCTSSVREGLYSYSSLSASIEKTPDVHYGEIPTEESDALEVQDEDKATDFGNAFHRLAELAVLKARAEGTNRPPSISSEEIKRQVRSNGLSRASEKRLSCAVQMWLSSDVAKDFFAHEDIEAEVPFCVDVDGSGDFYLVGEMDSLAISADKAYLIDYKTGGSENETEEKLYEKHRFQASCYAYALIERGISSVEANFVRVEQRSKANPSQPQVITYEFSSSDRDDLQHKICEAQRYSMEDK